MKCIYHVYKNKLYEYHCERCKVAKVEGGIIIYYTHPGSAVLYPLPVSMMYDDIKDNDHLVGYYRNKPDTAYLKEINQNCNFRYLYSQLNILIGERSLLKDRLARVEESINTLNIKIAALMNNKEKISC